MASTASVSHSFLFLSRFAADDCEAYTCGPRGAVSVAAVCNQTCLNGGTCVAPGQCACRRGYEGASCELDLDECAAGRHRCPAGAAHCVNMPGWYYCRCRPGFRTAFREADSAEPERGAICMGEAAAWPGVELERLHDTVDFSTPTPLLQTWTSARRAATPATPRRGASTRRVALPASARRTIRTAS